MYVETVKNQFGALTSLIRENYREDGKVKHRTISNISKLSANQINQIKLMLSNKKVHILDVHKVELHKPREYGASFVITKLVEDIGLGRAIYSKSEPWRKDVIAMIAGRIAYQGSKLSLTNRHNISALWELAGHKRGVRPDVDEHCYEALDRLFERQDAIQKTLAKKHLEDGCIILYDITSSYLEGEYSESELVAFGYNRDKKRGHEQIVIGLLTNKEGCPVAVEVFKGNTADQTTVLLQAKKIAKDYGVKSVIFIGDRGMLTPKRIKEVTALGFRTITALTHPQIRNLLEKKVIQLGLFDEHKLAEVTDPDNPKLRYILNKNPVIAKEATTTRNALISKTTEALEKLKISKKKRTIQELSAATGKILTKYYTNKYFNWSVVEGNLSFSFLDEIIKNEQSLDGCYIIRTDVAASLLNTKEVRASYKQLAKVETAFRNLKSMSLEMRPIYHHNDDRIRAHVFLCMLAYYVQWHMTQRLQPLFNSDGKGKNRCWSFEMVLEQLKLIIKGECLLENIPIDIISTPSTEQQQILSHLKIIL